jgi:hypothetical protein
LIQQRRGLKQHKIREKRERYHKLQPSYGKVEDLKSKQRLRRNETMAVETALSMKALYDSGFCSLGFKNRRTFKAKKV